MKNSPSQFILFFTLLIASPILAQESADTTKIIRLQDVVVTASRVQEVIAKSAVTIEKMNTTAIQQSAAPSFFDAIENMKGVQMLTPSLNFKVINTRGFANTTNVHFVQLVDGRSIKRHTSAHLLPTRWPRMISTSRKLSPVWLRLCME